MYIVLIGWMYVVTLMAATEENIAAGLATFFFYGALPCLVLGYLFGAKRRLAKIRAREAAELAEQQSQTALQAQDLAAKRDGNTTADQ